MVSEWDPLFLIGWLLRACGWVGLEDHVVLGEVGIKGCRPLFEKKGTFPTSRMLSSSWTDPHIPDHDLPERPSACPSPVPPDLKRPRRHSISGGISLPRSRPVARPAEWSSRGAETRDEGTGPRLGAEGHLPQVGADVV